MPGSQALELEPLSCEGRKRKILVQAVCYRSIAFHVGTVLFVGRIGKICLYRSESS